MKLINFTVLGIVSLVIQSNLISSYKILTVFPVYARSHYNVAKSLSKGLAYAGHEVTIVSPFKEQNPPENYIQIHISKMAEKKCKFSSNYSNIYNLIASFTIQ